MNQNELFGDNIVNFKYELFDVNHQYTKADLIKNNNITSAIFLLDQKVDPLEFLNRLKSVVLEFNTLTNREKELLKHWLRNTVDQNIRENVVKILEADKEGVEKMVANNAFMIEEMKEKVKKETRKQDRIEIVKNAIKLGMNDEGISKLTGLKVEEISELRTSFLQRRNGKYDS